MAGAYGITGDKVFTTEELYTAFSDEIIDGGVKFSEGPFGKIANAFENTLRQLSSAGYFSEDGKTSFLYRKEFANARQAYNFVKDYSLTIKKTGKVTERAKEFAKVDPGVEGKRESRSTVNLDKGEVSDKIIVQNGILILKINDKKKENIDFNKEDEINKVIAYEKNKQFSGYSIIYYNKLRFNAEINEG